MHPPVRLVLGNGSWHPKDPIELIRTLVEQEHLLHDIHHGDPCGWENMLDAFAEVT